MRECRADIEQVRTGICTDSRIGNRFLFPGVGYGGSCLPKDVRVLLHTAHQHECDCPIIGAVDQVNQRQRERFVARLLRHLGEQPQTGARFLQASTSEVYGDPDLHPQPDSYWGNVNPIGIRSCYDEGKRIAETLCVDYHRRNDVSVRIVRIFNTYGPRMSCEDGRVVSNFIVQALRGEPLTIYGEGRQTRSFCYVDDLIDGLVRAMQHPDPRFTGPVNLGNPQELTVAELAARVLEVTGSKSELHRHPLPEDDPRQRRPDITLARSTLSWHPRVPLEQGLPRTVEAFRKTLGKTASMTLA